MDAVKLIKLYTLQTRNILHITKDIKLQVLFHKTSHKNEFDKVQTPMVDKILVQFIIK